MSVSNMAVEALALCVCPHRAEHEGIMTVATVLPQQETLGEAYRRLRHGGDQYVRVEHVHINQGAQAVIGNVQPQASGSAQLRETQMHHEPDEDAA